MNYSNAGKTSIRETETAGDRRKPLLKPIRNSTRKVYKDFIFLFLFLGQLFIIFALALSYGIVALTNHGADVVQIDNDGELIDQGNTGLPATKVILGIGLILSFAGVISVAWVYYLSRVLAYFVNAILVSIILILLTCGIALFAAGLGIFGFCVMVFAFGILVLSLFIKPRIDFAATNLRIACEAIFDMPSTVVISMFVLVLQVLFILVWSVAAIGYTSNSSVVLKYFNHHHYNIEECTTFKYSDSFVFEDTTFTCDGSNCQACVCDDTLVSSTKGCFSPRMYVSTVIGLLLSLFWTSAVLSNIVHCTVATAISLWWNAESYSFLRVKEGFSNAVSSSLGSICFGSLLVATIRTARTILHFLNKSTSRNRVSSSSGYDVYWLLGCVQRIFWNLLEYGLFLLDQMMVFFNRYAFCFVAIYGHDFIKASKSAMGLFKDRGLTALMNDDIIDMLLMLGQVIIGVICLLVGYLYANYMGLNHTTRTLFGLLGFSAGYLISMVLVTTLSSAVATIYVLFAEHPEQLEASHPEFYYALLDVWLRMFPRLDKKPTNDTESSGLNPQSSFLFSQPKTNQDSYIPPSDSILPPENQLHSPEEDSLQLSANSTSSGMSGFFSLLSAPSGNLRPWGMPAGNGYSRVGQVDNGHQMSGVESAQDYHHHSPAMRYPGHPQHQQGYRPGLVNSASRVTGGNGNTNAIYSPVSNSYTRPPFSAPYPNVQGGARAYWGGEGDVRYGNLGRSVGSLDSSEKSMREVSLEDSIAL